MSGLHEVAPDGAVTGGPANSKLRRLASVISLYVALLLILLKLWAWALTSSVALLSSAIDSVVDVAAALATYAGVRYAERSADGDHRFGHGKGEAVAAFLQAVLLAVAGATLAFQSVQRLFTPETVDAIDIGLWVATGGVVAAAGLVLMQTWVVRRTASTAIAADRTHYITDIAVNIAVVAALGFTQFTGWQRADPTFALAIAIYMLWNSRIIAIDALRQLLDRELSTEQRQQIRETVLALPDVRGLHDLRTRDAGDRVFIEFHLEVDGWLTVDRGHDISDATEQAVLALFPAGAEIMAHLEPAGIEDERLDQRVHTPEE